MTSDTTRADSVSDDRRDSLVIAVAQPAQGSARTIEHLAIVCDKILASAAHADIVVFPEYVLGYSLHPDAGGFHGSLPTDISTMVSYGGEYYRIFSQLSFRYGKFILAGTHIIRDRGRLYNAAHLFGPDGSCFIHAKTHITPEEMAWGMTEGQILEPFTIDGVRVGVMICYEAEIPEVATILARKGADILICPSWSSTTAGYWRIRNCCAARCIENLVYAVHCPAAVSIRDARLPPPAAILSPCDPGFPSDGVLAEVTDHRTTVIEASLDLQLLYRNRRGGATTFLDRPRHAGLYRDHAAQLFASTVYEGAADGAAAPASVRVLPANAGSNARDCSRAYEESG